MGTVGLNFGSPTSGTGFDVSATVAQIVGNLQKIETPWKNELAHLQSQDTVISNLGTLYSALSNDLTTLTGFNGVLAQKTGSSSDTNVLQLTAATTSAAAGAHTVLVNKLAQTSSGYLTEMPNAADTLTGSITLQVGTGSAQTIALPSGGGTLASLAAAITASGVGVSANVLTDSSGSRLSLVSHTSGAKGNLSITANSLVDTKGITLQYSGTAGSATDPSSGLLTSIAKPGDVLAGSLSIQVGSAAATQFTLDSSNNTLATLAGSINQAAIGVTAAIVTNGDGSSSLSLVSGTLGSAGTLQVSSSVVDASPSLAFAQTVGGADASLIVDGVSLTSASNTVSNLIPGMTFQLLSASPQQSDGSLKPVQVVIGNDNSGVESAFNSLVTDYNALIKATNAQEGNDSSGNPEPMFGSPTMSFLQQQLLSGLNASNPSGFLDGIATNSNTTLAGKILISVAGGTQKEVDMPAAPNNTIDDLANAINAAHLGVTAQVVTKSGQSNLMFQAQTAGAGGALAVTSQLVATSDPPLGYTATAVGETQNATGALSAVAAQSDLLTGSIAIQAGNGGSQTISLGSAGGTLQDWADAINRASGLGATAAVTSDGKTLTLTSQTAGSAGALTVTSSILDGTNTSTANLNYTPSSDVLSLGSLGVTMNNDGTIAFDASQLDTLLNTDFSGVVGMFQGVNSWGVNFSNMLTNSGTISSTGILSLEQRANSNIEKTLNADIAKEESLIATQQKNLTAQLNQANEILQALPSRLDGIEQLYSAITGYNQKS